MRNNKRIYLASAYFFLISLVINLSMGIETGIIINNLGVTGLETTNQEYTSQRHVMLSLEYNSTKALKCRYINSQTLPSNSSSEWSLWEVCLSNKLWVLSENSGRKMVYYQVNYSANLNIANDSIYYNFTGSGLDTTNPGKAIIRANRYYSPDIHIIEWYNATDAESEFLDIPLKYNYLLWYPDGSVIEEVLTENLTVVTDLTGIPNNTTLYINLTVINSGSLKSKTRINFTIDNETPSLIAYGSYLNMSNNRYPLIQNEDLWVSSSTVNFSWAGYDNLSGVSGFSYSLSKDSSAVPDDIPEGSISGFASLTKKSFSGLSSGQYYFKIKPKDLAGNWGRISSINFSIDSTRPAKTRITDQRKDASGLRYAWEASSDLESGLRIYLLNLTYANGSNYRINYTTGLSFTYPNLSSGGFELNVCAVNYAGLRSCSNEETLADFTPPTIWAYPNVTSADTIVKIKAMTDEQAVCSLNSTEFRYTNTTYHEMMLELFDQDYAYIIKCTDMSGNSAFKALSFAIDRFAYPDEIIYSNAESFENTISTFTVEIRSSGEPVSNVYQSAFSMNIGESSYPFFIFDNGNGKYNISYMTPSEGVYDVFFSVNGVEANFNLTSKSLKLSGIYEDALVVPTNTKHISFHDSETRTGMATDSEVSYIGSEQNGKINASGISVLDSLFIFNTKKTKNFANSEKYLEEGFLDRMTPSFSYVISDINFIRMIIDPAYKIKSNSSDKGTGKYSYFLERRTSREGMKEVFIDEQ